MLLDTGVARIGRGIALYTGDISSPTWRGWVRKNGTEAWQRIWESLELDTSVLLNLHPSQHNDNGFDAFGNLWEGRADWYIEEETSSDSN